MIENGQQDGGYVLVYGGERIPFSVELRDRKKLAISVHPDLRLEVVAPKTSMREQVLRRVDRRAAWIVRQRRYFGQFQPKPPAPRFLSGETHQYLGRQYRLKVHEGSPDDVKLIGQFLHVWTKAREDRSRIKMLVDRWYRDHASRVFLNRIQACLDRHPLLKLSDLPPVTIRKMTRRWGSCTKSGTILLNYDLVKVPIHYVDYVVTHELCHLKIHRHSDEFYRLLSSCMPDWKSRKKKLDSIQLRS